LKLIDDVLVVAVVVLLNLGERHLLAKFLVGSGSLRRRRHLLENLRLLLILHVLGLYGVLQDLCFGGLDGRLLWQDAALPLLIDSHLVALLVIEN